ncbi:metal-dependent transcriptional regulator [bacterium]|nr:metal-dependent transcriptional regulator [bacterium]
MPTEAVENYLKAVWDLQQADDRATTSTLADRLGVKPPSVTAMVKRLAQKKPPLLTYDQRRGAALTPAGAEIALSVTRRHRLLELFLVETLGYRWDQVHAEAEKLEHAVSDLFVERVAAMLGDPRFDPHGDPIPTEDGSVPVESVEPLSDSLTGAPLIVRRVLRDDPAFLRWLAKTGIVPGARIEIRERDEFADVLTVRIENQNRTRAISGDVARVLLVGSAVTKKGR